MLLESFEVTLTKLLFDIVESRFFDEQGVTDQHTSRPRHLWTPPCEGFVKLIVFRIRRS
jgi:hypothetical protein